AKSETDRGVRQIVAYTQRLQYIARLERGRGAGGAARNGDVVDAHKQAFALDIGEAYVQIVWQAAGQTAVDEDFIQLTAQPVLEFVPQEGPALRFFGHLALADRRSLA